MKTFLLLLFISSVASAQQEEVVVFCNAVESCRCPKDDLYLTAASYKKSVKFEDPGLLFECKPALKIYRPVLSKLEENQLYPFLGCEDVVKKYGLDEFPPGCEYRWEGFDVPMFQKTLTHLLNTNEVLCSESMCTSAVFLSLVRLMKKKFQEGKISRAVWNEFTSTKGKAYGYINFQANPKALVEDLGIGKGKVLRSAQIPDKLWPQKGDYVQIRRTNGGGHSVVFLDYLRDHLGNHVGVCYWSSNPATNGYGKQCEPLETIDQLVIGRLAI